MSSPESEIIQCGKCGAENAPGTGRCTECGAPLVSYKASVSSGLKRLESEKLAFLGRGALVSKYDPEEVEKFNEIMPPPSPDGNDDFQTLTENDCLPEDLASIEDESADYKNSHTLQDLDPEVILASPDNDVPGFPSDVSEPEDEDFPSNTIQDYQGISDIGAIVADEVDQLVSESDLRTIDAKPQLNMLNAASIKMSPDVTIPLEALSQMQLERQDPSELHVTMPLNTPSLVRENAKIPNQDISVPPDAPSRKQSDTQKPCSENSNLTVPLNALTLDSPKAAYPDANNPPQVQCIDASESPQPYAQILIPAVHRESKSPQVSPEMSAIDKLKNQGLFETLSTHAAVSNSIDEISRFDENKPQLENQPWNADYNKNGIPSTIREADISPSLSEDMTRPQDLEEDYTRPQDPEDLEEDYTRPINPTERARVTGSIDEDLTQPQDPEDEDYTRPINPAERARVTGSIDEDLTRPQNPDEEVILPLSEIVKKMQPSSEKGKTGKATISAKSADSDDLESRRTMPISIKDRLPAEVLNQKHSEIIPIRSKPQQQPTVTETPKSDNFSLAIWIVFSILICTGIFYLLYEMGFLARVFPALDPYHDSTIIQYADIQGASVEPQKASNIQPAIREASQIIEQKLDFESYLESWIEDKLAETQTPEAQLEYLRMGLDYYPGHTVFTDNYIQRLLDVGQPRQARDFIQDLPDEAFSQPQIQAMYYQAFASDTQFIAPPVVINDADYDEIGPLGGGSTVTLKVIQNGNPIAAFKPLQTRRQSNYRAEIAAWRLCELLQCDFGIPWNRAVKIERNTFNKLYNRSKSKKRELYRKELADITWTKEGSAYYVYGTFKDWVPDFTRFPVEYIAFWKGWLSQSGYIEEFGDLKDTLMPLTKRANTKKLYTELLEQSPNLTTDALATQISQVLTFDFLIGNWDRFSGVPEWWGVNCQFKDNRIVSIDNGAAFPAYSNEKVQERFMMVERFSAHFIHALRMMDKEKTLELLFPEPTKFERSSFEQFWKQRAAVLTRVDSLCEKYGSERVLSFY